jgi:ABC-type multidrug transport system ATPase subunit
MVATHFMKEAEKYCDRVGMLADGKLKCLDTPSVLKTQYGGSGKVIVHAIVENVPGISRFIQGTFPQMQEMQDKTGTTCILL